MAVHHIGACRFLVTGQSDDCRCDHEAQRYVRLAKWSLAIFVIELLAGYAANSVALMSDALHVIMDGMENIVSVVISRMARGHSNENALRKRGGKISAALLCAAGVWIVYEGFERILTPHEVAWYMFVVAAIGLAGNIYQRKINNEAPDEHRNTQYFWQDIHLWSDILASIAVIIGGFVMMVAGKWYWIDGVLSVGIGSLIVFFTIARLLGFKAHSHNHGDGHSCSHGHDHDHH
ncbi:MAG: cation diffusion facilitator family transporter [Patescibacteria group bacterium]